MARMPYLAHSARPKKNVPAQEYGEHINATRALARRYAECCGKYSDLFGQTLITVSTLAGEFHDLGKLDDENQKVLHGICPGQLRVNHVDAAVAHLLKDNAPSKYAALVCYAHHQGLPSIPEESSKSENYLRDRSPELRERTTTQLARYLERHQECVKPVLCSQPDDLDEDNKKRLQLFLRLALSCQADADHSDTARHYRGPGLINSPPLLKPEARLVALNAFVEKLFAQNSHSSRSALRKAIYKDCCNARTQPFLYTCDAPVGSGKTTAVMAHLLKAAIDKGLRRIFVVAPYTNVIAQAVAVYRNALVLKGENPEEVVAEHHHKADYANPDSRSLTMLWHAPIVVTTAVQFFETLASNMPADLRKLHRLPGSAVFLDEVHAALPAHLWPQSWLWINELAKHWMCHFVFASGSLTHFWELPDFHPQENFQTFSKPILPELVSRVSRERSIECDQKRVTYKTKAEPVSLDNLVRWINHYEGPRILVLNTVQSAAVVAREMEKRYGRKRVEHLSTALTPADRERTLGHVKCRLEDKSDCNWTLVATSCMESGVDLSFRVGFRERASLMNLIQLGGRVNREHTSDSAEVWDFHFQIAPNMLLRAHPKFQTAARVLGELFREERVAPEFCKEALRREIRWDDTMRDEIFRVESTGDIQKTDFPRVAELFKVIDSATVTVVVMKKLQEQLRQGTWCGRGELQKHGVQIWGWRADALRLEGCLEEFERFPLVYGWRLQYDEFLGYMKGLLPVIEFQNGQPTVI